MTLVDWSSTLIGYPAHRRAGVPVMGASHCPVHDALRFAERLGFYTGWVQADAAAAHLVGLPGGGRPTWAILAECFVAQRIVRTEGPVGGSLCFAPAVAADGEPPADRSLADWAEGRGRPWLEVTDNEMAYWGGLDADQQAALLGWFCEQRPLGNDRRHTIDDGACQELLAACFQHGLSRNGALVNDGRQPSQQIWAGVHGHCMLDNEGYPLLSAVNRGWRLSLQAQCWQVEALPGPCPLDDQRGRAAAHGDRA